jgi:HK97 family phage major capsid protein
MDIVKTLNRLGRFDSCGIQDADLRDKFQKKYGKRADYIDEFARRGYDWQAVFSNQVTSTSFEGAIHTEVMRSTMGGEFMPHSDFSTMIPFEALSSTRAASDSVSGGVSTGGALIESEVLPIFPIPALLPTSTLLRAGSQIIRTDGNNVKIPRLYTYPPAGSGETPTVTLTNQAFTTSQVSLTGQWYSNQILISRQILSQAAAGSEKTVQWIKDLLAKSLGQLLDSLAVYGGGPGVNEALGLVNWSVNGSNSYDPSKLVPSITYSGSATLANIEQAHFNLNASNFPDDENRTWLLSPATKQKWAQIQLAANYPEFLVNYRDGRIGNYDLITSNILADNRSVLINANESVFGMFGHGFEYSQDIFTYASSNTVLLTIGVAADWSMLRGGACISTNSAAL